MKRILISDRQLAIPHRGGWKVLDCPTPSHVVSALGAAFPKGTEFELHLDAADLLWREIVSPLNSLQGFRQVLKELRPELETNGAGVFFEETRAEKDGEHLAVAWIESQPLVRALEELLRSRNKQELLSAFPLVWSAVPRRRDAGGGRACLVCLLFERDVLVVGREASGKPVRCKIPRGDQGALVDQIKATACRAGVATSSAVALPAVIRVLTVSSGDSSSEIELLRRILGANNSFESFPMPVARSGSVLRCTSPDSLTSKRGGPSLRRTLNAFKWAAAALFLASGAFYCLGNLSLNDALASATEAVEKARAGEKRIGRLRSEIAALEKLYGADAELSATGVRTAFQTLSQPLPSKEWSLNHVHLRQPGTGAVAVQWWGNGDKPSDQELEQLTNALRAFSGGANWNRSSGRYDEASRTFVITGGKS